MKKVKKFFRNWYHRLSGHVYIIVDNGLDENGKAITVYQDWVAEFHIASFDGKEIIIYPCNYEGVTYIKKFTDVIIGWGCRKINEA
jgi:calcineurin-like phosphoesterase family protein